MGRGICVLADLKYTQSVGAVTLGPAQGQE